MSSFSRNYIHGDSRNALAGRNLFSAEPSEHIYQASMKKLIHIDIDLFCLDKSRHLTVQLNAFDGCDG